MVARAADTGALRLEAGDSIRHRSILERTTIGSGPTVSLREERDNRPVSGIDDVVSIGRVG